MKCTVYIYFKGIWKYWNSFLLHEKQQVKKWVGDCDCAFIFIEPDAYYIRMMCIIKESTGTTSLL